MLEKIAENGTKIILMPKIASTITWTLENLLGFPSGPALITFPLYSEKINHKYVFEVLILLYPRKEPLST